MSKTTTFAHLSDLHLGGWRNSILTSLNFKTFQVAIEKITKSKVDFCLIAGDIFDSSQPPIELVEKAVTQFLKLKRANIPIYIIGGSHDYSAHQKNFLTLLDAAKVLKDVSKLETTEDKKINLKFTRDKKTQSIFTGISGRKNELDKKTYKQLNPLKIPSSPLKCFMFHTSFNDISPKLSTKESNFTTAYLPPNFNYYAGGHIHKFIKRKYSTGILSYPGALFPNNFKELSQNTNSSFNLVTFNKEAKSLTIKREFTNTYSTTTINFSADKQSPLECKEKILEKIQKEDLTKKIVLLKVEGEVKGVSKDIGFNEIIDYCYKKKALCVLKNTYNLISSSFKKLQLYEKTEHKSEKSLIEKCSKKNSLKKKEKDIILNLLSCDLQKKEDEKNKDFEKRTKKILKNILG